MAEKEWKKRRTRGEVDFVVSSPDLLANVITRRFDFVHSVLVLQHMVPALQIIYLEQLCDVLDVNGTGWVQIPHMTDDDGCDLDKSIATGGLQMHHTPMHLIQKAFHGRGCAVKVKDVGGEYVGGNMRSAIVTFKKKKLATDRLHGCQVVLRPT